jgi:AraC family transcriptional regulator
MTPVAKAIWFIEAHIPRAMSLDEVAAFAGVSPYHLAHAFARVAGTSVMSYARRRRLALAAQALAAPAAPNILTIALDHGYQSHEAFTRAFRAEFGMAPEEARHTLPTLQPKLQERLIMQTQTTYALAEPRVETYGPFSTAGLTQRYTAATNHAIPQQWQTFAPYLGHVPGQRPDSGSLGVCYDFNPDDGSFAYLSAVELQGATAVDAPLCRVDLPKARYLVFTIATHISTVGAAWAAIYNDWLPKSGLKIAAAPTFEFYDGRFDPMTGNGGFEIWIPLAD